MDVRKIIGESAESVEFDTDSYAFETLEREVSRIVRPVTQQVAGAIARGLAAGLAQNPRAQRYFAIEDASDLTEVFQSRMTRGFIDATSSKWIHVVNFDGATRDRHDLEFLSTIEKKAEDWVKTIKGR